jgi:hypothetical protein
VPLRRRLPLVVIAGLAMTGVATAAVAQPRPPAATESLSIGNPCVVGVWRSGATTFVTKFRNQMVLMTGLRGTIETDDLTGRSVTSWANASVARGGLAGHLVKERVRGAAVAHLHASLSDGYVSYSSGVPHDLVETFTYRHHTSVRRVHAQVPTQRSAYTCTATQLVTDNTTAIRVITK